MFDITIQRTKSDYFVPSTAALKKWARTALLNKISRAEMTIRIVDKKEMTFLNATYRKKNKPTNVLSFPSDLPDELREEIPLLGDVVICAEVIAEEAQEQAKSVDAHWAHMVVHGVLHLLGYDHEKENEAEIMESEEIILLAKFGFSNPYQITKGESHE